MPELIPVALENVYRLFNVGGTSLVSAAYEGEESPGFSFGFAPSPIRRYVINL